MKEKKKLFPSTLLFRTFFRLFDAIFGFLMLFFVLRNVVKPLKIFVDQYFDRQLNV